MQCAKYRERDESSTGRELSCAGGEFNRCARAPIPTRAVQRAYSGISRCAREDFFLSWAVKEEEEEEIESREANVGNAVRERSVITGFSRARVQVAQ